MTKSKKVAFWSGALCLVLLLTTSAQAAMVTTSDILADSKRAVLLEKLQRSDVQKQLIDMGVNPESAIKRVSNMTDEEIAKINGQLNALPAGAGMSNVELLLIIIIIILLV